MHPAVFLDKDGTLIENVPYNVDPALVCLAPFAAAALCALRFAGYRLVIVSNQSGVARGFFREAEIEPVKRRIDELLGALAKPDAFYYCPHHPDGSPGVYAVDCPCRKPRPGMLLEAARAMDLNLSRSWLIGDILDDIEAAHAAGCRALLIDNGNETEWRITDGRWPDRFARDLMEAANLILKEGAHE